MKFSFGRWLSPDLPACPVCGGRGAGAGHSAFLPIRNTAMGEVLRELCRSCRETIPWIRRTICQTCGRPEVCPDCPRRTDRELLFNRSAVRYDERMKGLLALYKYRGSERLEKLMAAMLASAYERVCSELSSGGERPHFHAVTSVPLALERLEERGFNQAERMARLLAAAYGLAYRPLLRRVRHTAKQSLKDRRGRIADMKGNFSAAEDWNSDYSAPGGPVRILLVDDVYTTGSTLNECAKTIRTAAAERGEWGDIRVEVVGLTWARS